MAKNKGQIYEEKAHAKLSKYELTEGPPAGPSSDKPDITIWNLNTDKTSGVELKTNPVAAGGLVMQYKQSKQKWELGPSGGDPEKDVLIDLADQYDVLKKANSKTTAWGKNVPFMQYDNNGNKIYLGNLTPDQAYKKDIAQYGGPNEIHVDVTPASVINYYNAKKCFYMNVGTHGFYLLGTKDPLGLNSALKKMGKPSIPQFEFPIYIRCRCQPKSPGYNFNMTLNMQSGPKSPYNLAPIVLSTGAIDGRAFNKNPTQDLLKALGAV